MLSGEEIEAAMGDHIIIHPFDRQALAGTTYSLHVGNFAWLHGTDASGLPVAPTTDDRGTRSLTVPAGAVVSVLTNESIFLDRFIGGLVHSRVGLVSRGFSHVSTIVDPTWLGPLLITFQNCSTQAQSLRLGEALVKLTFYRLAKGTSIEHDNRQPGRSDWISRMGFKFPPADEDHLNKPENCKVSSLREAFWESQAGIAHSAGQQSRKQRRQHTLLLGVASVGVLLLITSFWWLPKFFEVNLSDEALVGLVAAVASGVTFFLTHVLRR